MPFITFVLPVTSLYPGQLVKYEVIVKTGDVGGAGTDANVYICVFGDGGKNTGGILLNRILHSPLILFFPWLRMS